MKINEITYKSASSLPPACLQPASSLLPACLQLTLVVFGSDFTRNALALPMVATRRRASLGEGRDLLDHVISCVCDRRWIVTWWTMWSAICVSREDTSRQHCPRRLAHYSITGSSFGCCLLPILHFWLKLPLRSSAFDDLYREWCWALADIARRELPSHGSNVSGGGRRAEL